MLRFKYFARGKSDIVGSWTSFEWLLLSAWKESTQSVPLPPNPPYVPTNEWKNILFANTKCFLINCIWRKMIHISSLIGLG